MRGRIGCSILSGLISQCLRSVFGFVLDSGTPQMIYTGLSFSEAKKTGFMGIPTFSRYTHIISSRLPIYIYIYIHIYIYYIFITCIYIYDLYIYIHMYIHILSSIQIFPVKSQVFLFKYICIHHISILFRI